jgi:predicted cupin superfamily sugar epimerase
MQPSEIIKILDLRPLPGEGGWYRETFRSEISTAIYYLLTDDSRSAIHSVPGPEIWHFYAGDPVDIFIGGPDGSQAITRLGPDLAAGMAPQVIVPGGFWQAAGIAPDAPMPRAGYALMGTTMSPAFNFCDWKAGDEVELRARYSLFDMLCPARDGQAANLRGRQG